MISKKEFVKSIRNNSRNNQQKDFRADIIGNPLTFKRYMEDTMMASGIVMSGDKSYRPNAFWTTGGDLIVSVSQPTNNIMPQWAMDKFKADVEQHYNGKVEVEFLVNSSKMIMYDERTRIMAGSCTAVNSPRVAFKISPKQ